MWYIYGGFFGGSEGKEYAYYVGDPDSIPGLGRSTGGGHGNSLQYSYLENSMDRGAWQAVVHGITKSYRWTHTHTPRSKRSEKWTHTHTLPIGAKDEKNGLKYHPA